MFVVVVKMMHSLGWMPSRAKTTQRDREKDREIRRASKATSNGGRQASNDLSVVFLFLFFLARAQTRRSLRAPRKAAKDPVRSTDNPNWIAETCHRCHQHHPSPSSINNKNPTKRTEKDSIGHRQPPINYRPSINPFIHSFIHLPTESSNRRCNEQDDHEVVC